MFSKALLCLSTLHFYCVSAQGECMDYRGRHISNGLHYVPGPDTCTLCICENGLPKVCKAVLCSPPQDCRSFRLGNTCCEFICLDDVVKPADGAEANIRVAASGAASVVLLTIALVVYRVRKQKRRRPLHAEDQRSLTSIGYISGSMGYMGGSCETSQLGAWKPPSNYMPRGEAPPPYEEAMAQCRSDPMRITTEPTYHRAYTAVEAREDVCATHAYVNLPRPLVQMANNQNCYNAPLLQPVHPSEARETVIMPHPLVANMGTGARLTGSLGAISGRLSVPRDEHERERAERERAERERTERERAERERTERERAERERAERERAERVERPHNVPGFYTTHTALHRTIPRVSTALDSSTLEVMGFTFADRSLASEVRRSFHRPERANTGRSVPRNLNIASASPTLDDHSSLTRSVRPRLHSVHNDEDSNKTDLAPHTHPTLPLTVDKPSCECSYAGARDADDYRSECENCHSTNNEGWEEGGSWCGGTQTLQRRAPPPPAPAAATNTLPQPVTRHGRNGIGNPSNWENWFNTIPDSDTESEE